MPLTLVLGPANSAKAGEVLGAFAAAAPRGALLVVPTAPDAAHYARELAADGALLGSVLTFGGFAAELARRCGVQATPATALQRERLVARAVAATRLELLADAASAPGFAAAAGELFAELARWLITPARFAAALRAWAGEDARRAAYGSELAALVFAYRRELERSGRDDGERLAWRALDALRADPAQWGAAPVFFYGFDDLHPLQRDAVEVLARHCGAEVTVSLTYEAGRVALAARAEIVQELRPLADRVLELPALDAYYAPAARAPLHHLERSLFEPGAERVEAGGAVRLLEAGGERAEAELAAAEVLALGAEGIPAHEIAIVLRGAGAPALARVLERYGVPCTLEAPVLLGHTALGRGLLALARCAWRPGEATLDELLAYLRTPGLLPAPEAADALEAAARRSGRSRLGEVLALRADRLEPGAGAALEHARGVVSALAAAPLAGAALAAQARRLLGAQGAGRAPGFAGAARWDARACAAVLGALQELETLEPDLGGPELLAVLETLPVAGGETARADAVQITDPLRIRARRFRAVLVLGLQEGGLPAPGRPDPFLSDEVRWELNAAAGLRLRPHEDTLARERSLFYAVVSRATERVVLAYRSSDEEGNLALPSPFLRDVADVLDAGWWERRRRRLLADVVWPVAEAPTELERRRALVAAGAGAGAGGGSDVAPARFRLSEVALRHMRHREILSAGALEMYSECPVRWLIERQLEPDALEPTAEALARGSFMHDALDRVLRELGEAVSERSLPRALELLDRALAHLPADLAAGRSEAVQAATLRAIAADLRRYLEFEAAGELHWPPVALEQRFGFDDEDSLPALELGDGPERVRLRGAIDRIDREPGGRRAVVRDYKSGPVRQDYGQGRWASEGKLQVALYMLAVRELLGLEPVAGLYQPLRAGDLRPRGVQLREAGGAEPAFAGDGCEPDELDALLADARARATRLATALRSGALAPCPSTCSRDGCRHPGICRSA